MESGLELPIAVLLSGGGTTMQNLLDEREYGNLPIRIVQVIASKPGVAGIARAMDAGLPVEVIARKSFPSVEAYSDAIFERCRQAGAKLVCLAGFLQLLRIPSDFANRVMNIHPSLLPAFGGPGMYGRRVHEAVLEFGAKYSGCTVHFADNEFDHGPIILQLGVPVLSNDSVDDLAARVFDQECVAYPKAIRLFADGRLRVEGRLVRID
jgi:phosphoribosylglycinamide formyltransferase-1